MHAGAGRDREGETVRILNSNRKEEVMTRSRHTSTQRRTAARQPRGVRAWVWREYAEDDMIKVAVQRERPSGFYGSSPFYFCEEQWKRAGGLAQVPVGEEHARRTTIRLFCT